MQLGQIDLFPKHTPIGQFDLFYGEEQKMKHNNKFTMFPTSSKVDYYTGNPLHDIHHRKEMRQIAAEVAEQQIKTLVPQMVKELLRQSLGTITNAIQYDVETAVNIAFNDGRDIFTDSKTRKIVSHAILEELKKEIDKIVIKL